MKKILQIILFLILTTLSFSKEAYIASFNALRLGENKKDMVQVAKILKPFDIIGVVEVINKEGVEELVDALNTETKEKWEYHISPYSVGSRKYKEYFAYIYKKDKVKFLGSEGFYKDGKSAFLREPYGANFKIDNFDFTFILAHTIYGKSESERKAENYQMVDVYDYFQNKNGKENDVLIAGDFNLYALDESFKPLLNHKDNVIYAVDTKIKTTIGTKGRANSYDNFFLSSKYTKEFTGVSGGLDFSEKNPEIVRKTISDHIPVFIVVNVDRDDD